MKKLTRERIEEIYEEAKGKYWFEDAARAIEAEVLRINGVTEHSADAGKMDFEEVWKRACAGVIDRIDDKPRATGCPDTMDDTARFAADDLPAILRKQAG